MIKITPIVSNIKSLSLAGMLALTPMVFQSCENEADAKVDIFKKENVGEKKEVLVIDSFTRKQIDINGDVINDVSHGFIISKLIEENCDNVNVTKICAKPNGKNRFEENKNFLQKHVDEFRKILKDSIKYDAINISGACSMAIKHLSNTLKLDLTRENLIEKKDEIKSKLKTYTGTTKIQQNSLPEIGTLIEIMDSLSARGYKLYIAGGNDGKDEVNLLNLVNGAINVGALNNKNEKYYWSADNSLINRWEKGNITIKEVKKGYDITGDRKADIKFSETSIPFIQHSNNAVIKGSSISTPRAIVNDLNNGKL